MLPPTSCLQAVDRKAQRGLKRPASRQPVTAPKPASDAALRLVLFPRRHRILVVANPVTPASCI